VTPADEPDRPPDPVEPRRTPPSPTEPPRSSTPIPVWRIALRRDVVERSIRVAIVVGTILVLINHASGLMHANISLTEGVQMALTYCVPYCVATYASVQAIRGERKPE